MIERDAGRRSERCRAPQTSRKSWEIVRGSAPAAFGASRSHVERGGRRRGEHAIDYETLESAAWRGGEARSPVPGEPRRQRAGRATRSGNIRASRRWPTAEVLGPGWPTWRWAWVDDDSVAATGMVLIGRGMVVTPLLPRPPAQYARMIDDRRAGADLHRRPPAYDPSSPGELVEQPQTMALPRRRSARASCPRPARPRPRRLLQSATAPTACRRPSVRPPDPLGVGVIRRTASGRPAAAARPAGPPPGRLPAKDRISR